MWASSRSKDWPLADNQQGNRDLSPLTARNWIWATAWMNSDADLSPKTQKGMQLCWPPDFSTVNSKQWTLLSHATPRLWSAELWDSKFVLFWDAKFVTAATGNLYIPTSDTSLSFLEHTFLFPASLVFSFLFFLPAVFPLSSSLYETHFSFFYIYNKYIL